MLNLIKMDLYRLLKTKSFRFGLIVSVIISFVGIAGIAGIGKLMPLMEDGGEALLFMLPFSDWYTQVSIFTVILTSTTFLSLMVSCMISSNFINEEQASGYIKNIAGQVKDKSMLVASKFVSIAFICLCVIIAYAIGSTAASLLFLSKTLNYTGFGSFIIVLVSRFALYLAVNSIITFLCTLTKSKSLAIAFGIIFGTGITGIAYTIIATFFEFAFSVTIPLSQYTPDGLVFGIGVDSTGTELAKAVVIGVCYTVAFLFLSSLVLKKRDTK